MGDARTAALSVLLDWQAGRIDHLDEACESMGLTGLDAGLARELVLGVAAWGRLYEALSRPFMRAGEPPPPLGLTLALAAHQLFALDRIPAHAAVASAVDAVRNAGHPRLAGVVNAVARRLSELRLEERRAPGPLGRIPVEAVPVGVGVRHSLPDLLVADLAPALDGEDVEASLAALSRRPPLCTRTRPGKGQAMGRSVVRREDAWTWWDDPAEALAGPVAEGRCVVQDRTQGRVVDLALGVGRLRPGALVLDLCAAPGGKALALADAGMRVVAADASLRKVAGMPGELKRLVQDGCRPAQAEGAFECVLVDAPCSNTGVLGRRPEARWRYDRNHRDSLRSLQARLLAAASRLCRPEGRLIYSTCSVSPCENQGIAHALPGWRVQAEHRTWPDAWQGGGYAAVLVRS